MRIIVLAKQVPDTRAVGKDAMKADGTVNRAALPAIFNPEDLNALEQALRLKDQQPGSTVHILTMGPPRAADIIREAMFRGADGGYLLTDRAFAGADTLATSYALSTAINYIGGADVIISGRQAIDGDTAQVGPQVAQKLDILQVTYCEDMTLKGDKLQVKRRLDHGIEEVLAPMPCLITVNCSAAPCRPRNAKLLMKYKHACTPSEAKTSSEEIQSLIENRNYLNIPELSAETVGADLNLCGLSGSPTKVKTIVNVVFQAKEARKIEATDQGIEELMVELIENHTIG